MLRQFAVAAGLCMLGFLLIALAPLDRTERVGFAEAPGPRSVRTTDSRETTPSAGRVDVVRPDDRLRNRADRNVTPDGLTHGPSIKGDLTRIAPRPALVPRSVPSDTRAVQGDVPAPGEAPPPADAEPAAEEAPADPNDETRELVLLPRPIADDPGQLTIGKATIVLPGVAPLPLDAQCGAGAGTWPCGMLARTAVRNFLRSRSVRCEAPGDFGEKAETIESRCTLGGEDIGRWVVERGWAKAVTGGPYDDAEDEAKKQGLGIWR